MVASAPAELPPALQHLALSPTTDLGSERHFHAATAEYALSAAAVHNQPAEDIQLDDNKHKRSVKARKFDDEVVKFGSTIKRRASVATSPAVYRAGAAAAPKRQRAAGSTSRASAASNASASNNHGYVDLSEGLLTQGRPSSTHAASSSSAPATASKTSSSSRPRTAKPSKHSRSSSSPGAGNGSASRAAATMRGAAASGAQGQHDGGGGMNERDDGDGGEAPDDDDDDIGDGRKVVHKRGPESLHNPKNAWLPAEDALLRDAYMRISTEHDEPLPWNEVALLVPGRSGKQCRERWVHHLQPAVHKGDWTEEEDAMIFQQMQVHGKKWSAIAAAIPGRTDHAIKNRYYSTCRRIARQQKKKTTEGGESAESAAAAGLVQMSPTAPGRRASGGGGGGNGRGEADDDDDDDAGRDSGAEGAGTEDGGDHDGDGADGDPAASLGTVPPEVASAMFAQPTFDISSLAGVWGSASSAPEVPLSSEPHGSAYSFSGGHGGGNDDASDGGGESDDGADAYGGLQSSATIPPSSGDAALTSSAAAAGAGGVMQDGAEIEELLDADQQDGEQLQRQPPSDFPVA